MKEAFAYWWNAPRFSGRKPSSFGMLYSGAEFRAWLSSWLLLWAAFLIVWGIYWIFSHINWGAMLTACIVGGGIIESVKYVVKVIRHAR